MCASLITVAQRSERAAIVMPPALNGVRAIVVVVS
jgi:hypothetical protein